ncbi:MAG TPA: hypothetical protein DD734_01790 [Firmicutes bacterium]|nr:hypothetical protein [Bacillota bacterium]
MKKQNYYIITSLIIVVLAIFVGSKSAFIMDDVTEEEIQYKFGVGIVNGEPRFMDPTYFEVPQVYMSRDYLNNIDGDIIQAGILTFFGDSRLFVDDVEKSWPNISLAERELKYKVENQTLYVSSNGTRWEPVKFKVINDQPHKDKYDSSVTIYWVVYLECRWFKGEYEIFSIPNA